MQPCAGMHVSPQAHALYDCGFILFIYWRRNWSTWKLSDLTWAIQKNRRGRICLWALSHLDGGKMHTAPGSPLCRVRLGTDRPMTVLSFTSKQPWRTRKQLKSLPSSSHCKTSSKQPLSHPSVGNPSSRDTSPERTGPHGFVFLHSLEFLAFLKIEIYQLFSLA